MHYDKTKVTPAVGQVWKSIDGRYPYRRFRIEKIGTTHAEGVRYDTVDTEGTSRPTAIALHRLNSKGAWKLVSEAPAPANLGAPTDADLADPL